jgi:enoyl-CoA hydratase/carnithine racemase
MKIDYQDGYAWLRMELGKGNSFGAGFLTALDGALDELQRQPIGCLILTGYEKHFSTGLNLLELWEYDRAQMTQFLQNFCSIFMKLVKLPQVTIAAINGNAIAGGAILAQTADYRVMARGEGRIGVNEVNLGLPFPRQALEIVKTRLPREAYFDAIYRGLLFTPDEALKVGFVDEVCEPTELEERVVILAKDLASKSSETLKQIKTDLVAFQVERMELLGRLGDSDFIDVWFSDDTRARLGAMVENLKAKKR